MVKNCITLVIVLVIHHHVFSLTEALDEQQVKPLKKELMKELQKEQSSPRAQDTIDNYDLMVTEPSKRTTLPHHLRHRHRTGNVSTVTFSDYKHLRPKKVGDSQRKSSNHSTEINRTRILEYLESKELNLKDELKTGMREDTVVTATRIPRIEEREKQGLSPADSFFRRIGHFDDVERKKPQKWVHCLDLITPRLKGSTGNLRPKEITQKDSDIKRLSQLLLEDVQEYTEQEIVSILYQISNIHIRMYQWDYTAVTTILNILITGPMHDFRTLKQGIRALFNKWHLDTSMMQTFLAQTRIFRPPCIDITGYDGNTRKPGGKIKYTKPDKPKKHRNPDKSCESGDGKVTGDGW